MARTNVSPARWAALEILQRVDDGVFSSVLLASDEPQLEPADRSLCHELVLGVLRWQLYLDRVIEHYSSRRVASLDRPVLIALRLGLYQLRFLTRVPASAAVDESVKLVQAARLSSARAFVNAILRQATRQPDYDPAGNLTNSIERISVQTSHPQWLIERWIDSFGLEEAEAFARANNQAPAVAFRVVQTRASPREVLARLSAAGIEFEESTLVPGAWRVFTTSKVLREAAARGEIYLQDEASQLVAEVVDARAGERLLDLCAAPGSKTTLMADRTRGALVLASDVSARRLETLAKAVATQQLKNVSLLQVNACQELPFRPDSFDRILVDAPCSGTGTLRHNPEIRWRISADQIHRLASQQGQLLMNASKVLRPGGRLIYSTCSVEREENEDVVAEFLKKNSNYSQLSLKGGSVSSGTIRTWPHRHETDGFFVAAFEKRSVPA